MDIFRGSYIFIPSSAFIFPLVVNIHLLSTPIFTHSSSQMINLQFLLTLFPRERTALRQNRFSSLDWKALEETTQHIDAYLNVSCQYEPYLTLPGHIPVSENDTNGILEIKSFVTAFLSFMFHKSLGFRGKYP